MFFFQAITKTTRTLLQNRLQHHPFVRRVHPGIQLHKNISWRRRGSPQPLRKWFLRLLQLHLHQELFTHRWRNHRQTGSSPVRSLADHPDSHKPWNMHYFNGFWKYFGFVGVHRGQEHQATEQLFYSVSSDDWHVDRYKCNDFPSKFLCSLKTDTSINTKCIVW